MMIISGCAKVTVDDPQTRAHWIEANESAPFRGILLNDYTYFRLRDALERCRHGEH